MNDDGAATAVDRLERQLDRFERILAQLRDVARALQEGDGGGGTEGELGGSEREPRRDP